MRARIAVWGLLLSLSATACAGSGEGEALPSEPGASPSASRSAASSEEDPGPSVTASPRASLRRTVRDLARANTGSYRINFVLGPGSSSEEAGVYQLRPAKWSSERTLSIDGGAVRFAFRSVGERRWFRVIQATSGVGAASSWPCWVDYDDARSAFAALGDVARPLSRYPPAVVVAGYAMGERAVDGSQVEGTTDLFSVVSLISGKLVIAAGLDPRGDATVPATFDLDGGDLRGFRVDLADLPQAIADAGAGGDLDDELESLAEVSSSIETTFDDVGAPVTVVAPPRDEVVRLGQGRGFAEAMRECGGG